MPPSPPRVPARRIPACRVPAGRLALLLLPACAAPATVVPVPSGETRAAAAGWLDGRPWSEQHADCKAIARAGEAELVFLGDSITQSWGGPGRRVGAAAADVWERWYGNRRAAAFGISGDRTQHVLWRIQDGTFEGLAPRVVVLMIGTNNLPHDEAPAIARGVRAVVDALLALPGAPHVVLMGVPPRGVEPEDPLRARAAGTNRRLRSLGERERVTFVDLSPALVLPDGRLDPERMRGDGVHLAPGGYEAWAAAIEPVLAARLGGGATR